MRASCIVIILEMLRISFGLPTRAHPARLTIRAFRSSRMSCQIKAGKSFLLDTDFAELDSRPRASAALKFWFGEDWREKNGAFEPSQFTLWFQKNKATDDEIREKFGPDIKAFGDGKLEDWRSALLPTVAGIILGDQFTRNIYRDSADAFSLDPIALEWSKSTIESGEIKRLPGGLRLFAMMPLVHDEKLSSHELMLAQLQEWKAELEQSDSPDPALINMVETSIHHQQDHAKVLLKWGRYPHRNAVLGRESTPEEKTGLANGSIPRW